MKLTPIHESTFGVYVWQMPDGSLVCDEDKNYMSIAAEYGDVRRIAEITSAAAGMGLGDGHPLFIPGRKIDDEEYERQKERLAQGLIPDEYDWAAYAEEVRHRRLQDG